MTIARGLVVITDISDGGTGSNSAIIQLYKKHNLNTGLGPTPNPSGTFTYTFSSGVLSGGTLNGWTQSIPTIIQGEYIWVTQAVATSVNTTVSVLGTSFSAPVPVLGQGIDGADGLNTAIVNLYRVNTIGSPAPTNPSGTFTYTFSTNTLSGGTLNGWTTAVPSVPQGSQLWMRQAVASSNTDTDTIPSTEFSAAVVTSVSGINGTNGTNGLNNIVVSLYHKNTSSSTPPTAFTGTATYTFSTKALTGLTFNGWSTTPPTINSGEYLWVRQAVASSTNDTDTIAIGEWSSAVVMSGVGVDGSDGIDGNDGLNTAVIYLYRVNTIGSPTPSLYSGTFTYTFSTNTLSGGTLNSWSTSVPTVPQGSQLWMAQAIASSTTNTDTIAAAEFSTPVVISTSGVNGAAATNTAIVRLHAKNTSSSTPPTAFTGTGTYTFSTGTLTGMTLGAWTLNPPTLANGEYLWVRQALASSTSSTDTIAIGEWSAAVVMSAAGSNGTSGTNGTDGLNTAVVYLYRVTTLAASAPANPSGTFTYTFSTNALSGGTLNGWSTSVPTVTQGNKLWMKQAVASSTTNTDIIPAAEFSAAVVISASGVDGPPGPEGEKGVTSGTTFPVSPVADEIFLKMPESVFYRWDAGSATWTTQIYASVVDNSLGLDKFINGIEPVTIHTGGSLPTTKSTENLSWNGKLYRWNGSVYTAAVPTTDLTGTVSNSQIANNAITEAKIASSSISIAKFAAGIEPVTIHTGGSLPGTKTTEALTWNGKLYRWNGSVYTAAVPTTDLTGQITGVQITDNAITAAKINTNAVTADKIQTNAVTAAKIQAGAVSVDKLDAKAVTSSKVNITDLNSVLPNPDFSGDNWYIRNTGTVTIISSTSSDPLNQYLRIAGSASTSSDISTYEFTPVVQNDSYLVEFYARTNGTVTTPSITIFYRSSNTYPGTTHAPGTYNLADGGVKTITSSWTRYFSTFTVPAGVSFVRPSIRLNHTAGNLDITGFRVYKRSNGELIVDGSIVADKIATNAITADKIQTNAVTSDKIQANAVTAAKIQVGSVNASHIQANSITASKIAVTSTDSLFPDSTFENADLTLTSKDSPLLGSSFSTGETGQYALRFDKPPNVLPAGQNIRLNYNNKVPVMPGQEYWLEYRVKATLTNSATNVRLGVAYYNPAYLSISYITPTTVNLSTSWTTYSGKVTIPANAKYACWIVFDNSPTASATSLQIDSVSFRRANAADLIVDGSITADKLNVNSLDAVSGTIGTFTSGTPGGERTEISDGSIKIYDSSNTLRVAIGLLP